MPLRGRGASRSGPMTSIWYADFARGYLGRLDLATGEVKEWPSPSGPKSEPYGMVFTKGAVWYSESGAKPNTIVRFDPATEKFQSWAIPGGGDIVRNMDVMPDGNPVMANSLANQVGDGADQVEVILFVLLKHVS